MVPSPVPTRLSWVQGGSSIVPTVDLRGFGHSSRSYAPLPHLISHALWLPHKQTFSVPAGKKKPNLHKHGGQREEGEADLHADVVGQGRDGAALEHLLHAATGCRRSRCVCSWPWDAHKKKRNEKHGIKGRERGWHDEIRKEKERREDQDTL